MSNNKYKVLVVEDDQSVASMIQTILETNGYQVLTAQRCQQGILMMTSHVPDLVLLDLGANDYITKPFGTAELLARVRASLRTNRMNVLSSVPNSVFELDDLIIDYDRRQVSVSGRVVHLTQTEFNILSFLSQHVGKVMTYSVIIRAIWGAMDDGSVKKLQVNMANIRKKLGCVPGENRYIINELGVGYRMPNCDD